MANYFSRKEGKFYFIYWKREYISDWLSAGPFLTLDDSWEWAENPSQFILYKYADYYIYIKK